MDARCTIVRPARCTIVRPAPTYLDGVVAVRRGGAGRAEEAAALEHPEREHDLGVRGGVPEPGGGGLHAQNLRHRDHRVAAARLAQAVLEQHRDHCAQHTCSGQFRSHAGVADDWSGRERKAESRREEHP